MTTKKQRREQVAAKRAAYDAETKRLGLEAQKRDRNRREEIRFQALRAEQKKATALKMRKQHEATVAKSVEKELADAYNHGIDLGPGVFLDDEPLDGDRAKDWIEFARDMEQSAEGCF